MKIQVRQSVFETNSSTTHSLTIMMKDDYDAWLANGTYRYEKGYYYDSFKDAKTKPEDGKFYTREEVKAFISQLCDEDLSDPDCFDEYRKDYGFSHIDDGNECLEDYYDEFTTPGGETIVVFGEYGNDY